MARLTRTPAGWVLFVCGDEDESEAAARAALDEVLEPDGLPEGRLPLESGGVTESLRVVRDEAHPTLRLERTDAMWTLRGHRTALKAWLELWGLTGEGAGDYYLELNDASVPGTEPAAVDLRLHKVDEPDDNRR